MMTDERKNTYWSRGAGRVTSAKVDAFVADINAVCKKHGLEITHEDQHGSFIVSPSDGLGFDFDFGTIDGTIGDEVPE